MFEGVQHDRENGESVNSEQFFSAGRSLEKSPRWASKITPVQMQSERESLPISRPRRRFTATQLLSGGTATKPLANLPGTHYPRPTLQAKLAVGQVGDRYEREADRVAKQVVGQIHNPIPPTLRENKAIPLQRQTQISPPRTSSNVEMIQAKFMEATINKNTTIYDDSKGQPNTNKSQSVKRLKTAIFGSNPTVEVDPNQTYTDEQSGKRWVRATYSTKSLIKRTPQTYEGWIKWEHVQWKDDMIPELQHQVNDKFFGLGTPFHDSITDRYKGYGFRKEAPLELYTKFKIQKDTQLLKAYEELVKSKQSEENKVKQNEKELKKDKRLTKYDKIQKQQNIKKANEKIKLIEKKLKNFDENLEIGQKIYQQGNYKEKTHSNNEDLINRFEEYFSIPDEYLEMNDEEVKQLGKVGSEQEVKRLDKHSREMVKSIKTDSHWQNKRWFAKTKNEGDKEQRDTGHRSKLALRATIKTGQQVHFLLDGLDMSAAVNPQEKHYGSFTCKELRHLYRNWSEYRDNVTFWLKEKPVSPPWDTEPDLWQQYDKPTRRESIDDELPKNQN